MENQTDAVIGEGKVVAIYYTLKNDAGEVLDSNRRGGKPLAFLHGMRGIVAGLEKALGGKKKDDFVAVSVTPEEGYGLRREELVQKILRSALPEGAAVKPGMTLTGIDPNGQRVAARVVAVEGDEITVDKNHPLAGKTLHFEIMIVGVRDATSEERAHGHVHGPHGHKH